ncbi:ComF family protein [Paraburkholderia caballeronis]|uniref:ComF family protein n=1 Tax=Paraburkholderia caballeronis TaxID=416943 RepID=UPI001064DB8B|nr:ComF family protein [Paraburkholderia caballeronis]TDV18466.1 ComF family protein [Paraburkholderia caballeronis]TDV19996.1 ComF family protein [Paraburkholderia caballeronis]TDV28213.1 ComF family protein [Paraburkholderia caballeronis]
MPPSPLHPDRFRPAARIRVAGVRVCQGVRQQWPRFAQFVLPNRCSLCGNLSQTTLCAACDAAYWNEPRLRCAVCAVPLNGSWRTAARGYRCSDCAEAPPPFDATLTLADYRAPLDLLARRLKFRARVALGHEFALRLARAATDALDPADPPDLIAPVPLSRRRLIERGYNQAWQIAKPLARALHVRADATLARRIAHTAPQSRLDRETRRRNVAGAFAVTKPVRGLHVAVVDDVMTSGATLEALARTLKTAGARRVTNFVALRTPKT